MNGQVIRTITIRGTSEGLDKLTGDLKALAAAEKNVAVVSDDLSKKQLSLAAAMKQQTLRLDETARAQNNIARETRLADRGLRENLITQQQHAQIITLANQRYGGLATATMHARTAIAATAKTTALSSYEMLNFGRQIADVAVSLQAGQGLLTVGVQQGTQMADILATSGATVGAVFRQIGGTIARFALSAGGVATGLAAIGGAGVYSALKWNEAKVDVQRSLMGIGQQSGATAGQMEEIAKTAASTTKITTSGARETAIALAQTGKIGVEQIRGLVNIAHDFAKVLGEDIPDAAKIMAQAFADPAKGVEALATRFSILPKQIEQVQRLAAQGNFAGAQDALKDVITPQLKDAANSSSAISHAWESTKKFVDAVGSTFNEKLDKMFDMGPITQRIKAEQEVLDLLKAQRDAPRPKTAEGRFFAIPVDKNIDTRIEASTKRLAELNAEMKKVGEDRSFVVLAEKAKVLSEQIAPGTKQINEMQNALTLMNKALSSPAAIKGMDGDQVKTLTEARDLTQDQLGFLNRIRAMYPGMRTEIGKQLNIMEAQVSVAGARTQEERLSAQQAVDYRTALAQGASYAEALAMASSQRRVSEAGIAKQENDMIQLSQAHLNISQQITFQSRARAQAQATQVQLVSQGVSEQTAAVVAGNQYAATMAEVNRNAENIIGSLTDQAAVASAVGGQAKVAAQAQATYNDMVRQGYSESQALAASEQTRAAGMGAISASMAEQLASLQDQGAVMAESTGAGKIAAQSQGAYNKAIREGASASEAAAIAEQTYANGVAAANAAVDQQIYALEKQTAITKVAGTSMEASTKAAWAYRDAIRSGADSAHALRLEEATLHAERARRRKQEEDKISSSQGNAPGVFSFPSQIELAIAFGAPTRYGMDTAGGYTVEKDELGYAKAVPTSKGLEFMVNSMLGGTADAKTIQQTFKALIGGELQSSDVDIQQSTSGLLSRLTELMPEDQKAGLIQSEIDALKEGTQSLATMELIKQLTDQLKQLTEATEENTSATESMTDVLSPFYSSDPRSTHLGFRAFAGGGIMTQYGELPLRQYQGGGIANSPQVAVFGEGSTPEAYVPAPAGRIPVKIEAANSNQKQRPITVNINVMGNADQGTVAALKSTSFQQAQAMRRAMR